MGRKTVLHLFSYFFVIHTINYALPIQLFLSKASESLPVAASVPVCITLEPTVVRYCLRQLPDQANTLDLFSIAYQYFSVLYSSHSFKYRSIFLR
jgi:hypothetical protein